MEYRLKINEDVFNVDVDIWEGNELLVSIGEEKHKVSYRVISDHQTYLLIDGKAVNAYLAANMDGKLININGSSYRVVDVDALEQMGTRKGGDRGHSEITPQMPSVVISLLVGEGDEVEKGQGVITLSSMKMETTLRASFNGKVTKVNCSEGDKVMPGDILVEIEPE